jgi:hypothetical protein
MKSAVSTSLMLALFFPPTSLAQRRDPVVVKSKRLALVIGNAAAIRLAFGRQPFFHLSLKSADSSFAPERLLATRAITNRRSERRLR